jgi:hypothetical protein
MSKTLYIGFIDDKEIIRTEIEWLPQLEAIESARYFLKKEFPRTWSGAVIIDDEPILSSDKKDLMFLASVERTGADVDFLVKQLNWRGGSESTNRPGN